MALYLPVRNIYECYKQRLMSHSDGNLEGWDFDRHVDCGGSSHRLSEWNDTQLRIWLEAICAIS